MSVESGSELALSILTAAESAHAFSAFLPSYFTIRTFAVDGPPEVVQQKLKNLRSGYIPATIYGLGLGGLVSYIAKSPLPLVFSGITVAIMIALYEQAIPKLVDSG